MNYVGIDLSFAKSGLAVISVKDRNPSIKLAYLIVSDTKKSATERIDATVTEIKYVAAKVDAEVLAKEASVVGRASTATNVIKTHGVYEHVLADRFSLEDRSEEHTSELQSRFDLVCRLLLEKKKQTQ